MMGPLFLVLMCAFAVGGAAQMPTAPTPQLTPKPLVNPNNPMGSKTTGGPIFATSPARPSVIENLYRKPTGKELQAIAPSPEILNRFKEFLKRPGTGIF